MNHLTSYVRLPPLRTSEETLTIASEPIDENQFAARQIEFVRHLFGYRAYLREQTRATPTSDAFLPVLVMLLETLELNSPVEARQCVAQLTQIMPVIFSDNAVD